jgi:nucleotide-binding universal stress UspA family protein
VQIRNIAVPVDEAPDAALRVADRLAERCGATVHLFSLKSVPEWAMAWAAPGSFPVFVDDDLMDEDTAARTRKFAAAADQLTSDTRVTVRTGDSEAGLFEFLEEASIDLVIMSHSRVGFWSRLLHTNLTDQVTRSAQVSVLAIGSADGAERIIEHGIRRLLIGTSDRADAIAAAEFSAALAENDANLVFVHVDDGDDHAQLTPAELEAIVAESGVQESQTVTDFIVPGSIAETLLTKARELEADVTVVGSRPHEGVGDRLVGTVADRVLRAAESMPVLVIPRKVSQHVEQDHALDRALAGSMDASDPLPLP